MQHGWSEGGQSRASVQAQAEQKCLQAEEGSQGSKEARMKKGSTMNDELTNQKRELIWVKGKWFYSILLLIDCTYHFVNKYFDKILNWKRFVIAYYSFPFLHFKNLLLLWSIKSKKKLEAIKTGSWISKRAAQRHKCKLLSVSHWTKNTKQASKGKKI